MPFIELFEVQKFSILIKSSYSFLSFSFVARVLGITFTSLLPGQDQDFTCVMFSKSCHFSSLNLELSIWRECFEW